MIKKNLLGQLKERRVALGLTQEDVSRRTGMSRQQYQRIEAKGNPRLETLEMIAKALNGSLLFIPQDKLFEVQKKIAHESQVPDEVLDNPWQGLIEDDNDE